MKKNEKTIEELTKQDLKKLAKKYCKDKSQYEEFSEHAESFDSILKKTFANKDMQEVIQNNICFAAIGGENKDTGVKSITFKFGQKEAITKDLLDSFVKQKLESSLDGLIGKLEKSLEKSGDLLKNKDVVGRA